MAHIVGSQAVNFHEGSRSEILADYLFTAWGTVTPVRRQDDYGMDLYCTLWDRMGLRAIVREYYTVQVKSGMEPWELKSRESVKWLVGYPTPLFLACVDKKNGIVRVYHLMARFYVRAFGKLPNRLLLTPQGIQNGEFIQWTDGEQFSLSAPILQATLADLTDANRMAKLRKAFEFWVQFDRDNCNLAQQGLLRFRMPDKYVVNEPPTSFGELGYAVPEREFLDRGILAVAEGAECIGGQFGRLGDFSAALRSALLVRYLQQTHPALFDSQPRWSGGAIPGDLGMLFGSQLNQVLGMPAGSYLYKGLDEIGKAMDNLPMVSKLMQGNNARGGKSRRSKRRSRRR